MSPFGGIVVPTSLFGGFSLWMEFVRPNYGVDEPVRNCVADESVRRNCVADG